MQMITKWYRDIHNVLCVVVYKIFFSNIILSKPSGGGYVKSLKVESSIAPLSTAYECNATLILYKTQFSAQKNTLTKFKVALNWLRAVVQNY